jgi:AcrR family transcriptional regulator
MADDATTTTSRRARRDGAIPRRSGDLHEAALLDVAGELLREGKFDATSIAEIARRAGLSRQGFYFYFASKDDVVAHLVSVLFATPNQQWAGALERGEYEVASDILLLLIRETAALWVENLQAFRAAVETEPRSAVISEHWVERVRWCAELLTPLVVASTHDERLRDPAEARRMITTLVWMIERNNYMHFVHDSGHESDEAMVERVAEICVRALKVD